MFISGVNDTGNKLFKLFGGVNDTADKLSAVSLTPAVRHVTGNDEDYLRKIPSSGCTEIRASQRATIGVLPTYATR
jgi:hypothetical protein